MKILDQTKGKKAYIKATDYAFVENEALQFKIQFTLTYIIGELLAGLNDIFRTHEHLEVSFIADFADHDYLSLLQFT